MWFMSLPAGEGTEIFSFEDCVAAGYPVMESYPPQCATPGGRIFIEGVLTKGIYKNASTDMIRVDTPFPGAVTGKEFSVIGQARGTWFFEASFPVEVLDKDGKRLAQGVAQAQGEWMTTDFVAFKADIKVPQSYIGSATLVLHKDNPSDDRKLDASVSFPFTIEY